MPRIDPLSLLKCLSVLLGPTGGIKSKDEVHRLANLMTKFSKKLVSKCIYIQILKTTNTELLSQFMTAGGWNLVHSWLSDGIVSKNWALLQELLELLLLCPVDIERLKSNNCPKLIKGLSKEAKDLTVRSSAGKLVDQWLKLVKSEVTPHPVTPNIKLNIDNETTKNQTITINDNNEQETNVMISKLDDDSDDNDNNINNDATVEMNDLELKNNCVELIDTNNINDEQDNNNDEEVVEEEEEEVEEVEKNLQEYQNADKQINVKPVQFKIINKTLPGQSQPTQISKQSFVVYPAAKNKQPVGPVYKIIIKDGKQLLKKVDTVPKNLKKVYNNDLDINNDNELCDTDVVDNENSFIVDNCEVKKITNINNIKSTTIDNTDNNNSDVNKSNDKENRDSRKKNDDKITTSSSSSTAGATTASDKKHSSQSSSSSKSKHSSSSSSRSSSSSHRSSSHRSSSSKSSSSSSSKSSRDRDRHHSSSSKHGSSSSSSSSRSKTDKDKEKDKDKDKDKDKKDQAEKDKATLEKIQGQSLSTKFGKIPKKKSDDDKNDTTLRKSSTDSRDSSKENKDNKKITSPSSSSSSSSTTTTNSNSNSILEKKNISISIENRKNSTDQPRPKTVKTFNSKFRSTGLEEEVKPPPSKSSIKKPNIINDNKKLFQPKLSLKRPSPLRDTPISDKKIKLSLEPPTPTGEEKKGAIKLIAPKPKPMVLQESDMFMDALMTASTKGKEPRKRKRRTSLTKDDKNDTKKSDGTNEQGGKDDESPASPPPSEKSLLPVKPDFKFYQDTLETDEDKEEKEKSQDDDESQDDNDKNRTNSSGGGDDDDERSQTPTNDDDSSDKKHSPLSPDSEVRYVDGLRSVLVIQKRKGPKKLLKWNTELESIRYFELDETERVNVTKTFTDMKQMEKQGEREAFQMARKLSTEDTMEEKIKWRVLIPLDLPPALVDPGKDSKERDIQYAREKSILQALYFNRGMIPDSPAEPDEERHHVFKDPIIIPLDDLTGNKESEKDFSMLSWPEPKPKISIPPPSIIPQQQIITQNQQLHYQQFTQHNQMLPPNMQNGPMQQQIPPNIMSLNTINELNNTNTGIGGGGGWRTGDGKVVVPDVNIIGGGNNIPGQFVSGLDPLIMAPTMIPPPNLYHQQPPDNFNGFMGNDDNNFGHMQNNFQGPPGIFNNNNNNSNFRGGSGGNNNNGGGGGNGVMMANRGRGGNIPVWFRGGPPGTGGPGGLPPGGPGGPGPMRGVWNNGGRGNWRNNGKPVCRQFVKNGFCRVGDKCQYFHPGPNCPPF